MRVRPGTTAGIICGLLASIGASLMGCGIGWVELTGDGLEVGAGGMTTMSTSSSGGGASSSSGMGGMGVGGTSTGGTSGSTSGSSSSSSSSGVPQCYDCLKPIWAQSLMGPMDQAINDMAVDKQGNIIFVGSIAGASGFTNDMCPVMNCPYSTAGGRDIYVVKLDSTGTPLWVRTAGTSEPLQEANSVAIDNANNVIVAGKFKGSIQFLNGPQLNSMSPSTYDIFVAKFDPNGTHVWSKRFGDSSDQYVGGVAVDDSGNVVLGGYFSSTLDFGNGAGCTALTSMGLNDAYVAKLSGVDGACLRTNRYGDTENQLLRDISVDMQGNIFVIGECKGSWLIDATPIDCGLTQSNVFAAKFDVVTGTAIWAKTWGDEVNSTPKEGKAIAVDSTGNAFITGRFKGMLDFGAGDNPPMTAVDYDAYVAKLDTANGNALWSRQLGSPATEFAENIAVVGSDVFLVGATDGDITLCGNGHTNAGSTDAYVVAFDTAGQCMCGTTYGDAAAQSAKAAAIASNGDLVLGFDHQMTIDLGCMMTATSVEANDVLVTRMTRMP